MTEITRRPVADRLRYLAAKLREGERCREAVALSLDVLADEAVTEHAVQMSGGGYHVRNDDPEIERIYPLAEWIVHGQRFGGKVFRRRVIVVEDWAEVPSLEERQEGPGPTPAAR